ncbi:MAG: hypothetical protein ACOX2L_00355 [Anaerolineae bacterium]|jgi:hypothetical protein|nr:hypothetical protein [Chloroflexota bacterium]
MDEGWIALALMFVGLLILLFACLYYITQVMAEAPLDGRIGWGLAIAGSALFFAGGSLWRRGVPRE